MSFGNVAQDLKALYRRLRRPIEHGLQARSIFCLTFLLHAFRDYSYGVPVAVYITPRLAGMFAGQVSSLGYQRIQSVTYGRIKRRAVSRGCVDTLCQPITQRLKLGLPLVPGRRLTVALKVEKNLLTQQDNPMLDLTACTGLFRTNGCEGLYQGNMQSVHERKPIHASSVSTSRRGMIFFTSAIRSSPM